MIGKILNKLFAPGKDSDSTAPKETFKQRSENFWAWITPRTEAMAAAADQGMSADSALSDGLDKLDPMISAEFFTTGSGKHGLQLTARGESTRKLLVRYLVATAPKLPGWSFVAARPAWKKIDAKMSVTTESGMTLKLKDFTVALRMDAESQKIALGVNHRSFGSMSEAEQSMAGHYFVDGILGDNLLEAYIGPVDMLTADMPAERMPLAKLRDHLVRSLKESGADPSLSADDLVSSYKLEPGINPEENPRADIESGWSMNGELIKSWLEGRKERYDLLEGTGAAFAYLTVPNTEIADEEQRRDLGVQINDALREQHAGNVIGAAHGVEFDYFDLIVYDEALAIEILRPLVAEIDAFPLVKMSYFAPMRRNDMFRLK